MSLKLITPPAAEPVTLVEAKLHCKVEHDADDTLIAGLIVAAREQCEHRTGRVLITQTWELALDAFPAAEIELEKTPAQSIASVKYRDGNSVEQTVADTDYTLDDYNRYRHWLLPAQGVTWPSTLDAANAVKVRFVAGYGASGAAVPQSLRSWMALAIATLYKFRESVVAGAAVAELPRDFYDGLLDAERVWRL